MSKHTEGPWMMDKGHMIIGGNGMRVAYADLMSDGDEALVIAAPDLLEALEKAISRMEEDAVAIDGEWGMGWPLESLEAESKLPEEIIIARAAIAKAKGESQ